MDLDTELKIVSMVNAHRSISEIAAVINKPHQQTWNIVKGLRVGMQYGDLPATPDGRKRNPDAFDSDQRLWVGSMLRSLAIKCKRNRVPFDLTRTDVPPIPTTCGALPYVAFTKESPPVLDLIHPHLGYVKGNVMWVSKKARDIRGSATPVELAKVAKFYHQAQQEHHDEQQS